MRIPLLFLLCAAAASAIELSSAPTSLRSLNGTGFSPWQNLDDARCDTTSAAAAECYARSDTETFEAYGFVFDLPSVNWLEARWDVSVVPVPADGWILRTLQLRWSDGALDLSSPNYTSHDEGVSLRIRATGNVDWRSLSMYIALESTNEDTTFLISCVELRAGSDWTPPETPRPRIFHYELGLGVAIALLLVIGLIRRACYRKNLLRSGTDVSELIDLAPSLYLEDVRFNGKEIIESGDAFIVEASICVRGEERAIAHRLRKSGDIDRFRNLRAVHHANLLGFLGLHDGGARGIFTVWRMYKMRLNDWRRTLDPCVALSLLISQVAACALSALQRHCYTHGDISCRNLVVKDNEFIALVGAGHARDHDVSAYVERDDPRDPLRWMAPEAVKNGVLDLATDRWSLGVLIWEACSEVGAVPFGATNARTFVDSVGTLYLEKPQHATPAVWSIAQSCLHADPGKRANVANVRDSLLTESKMFGTDRVRDDEEEVGLVRGRRLR